MEKMDAKIRFVKLGLLLAALTSSAYLLMLGWYNTLSLDDYGFIADIERQGRWIFVKDMYLNWQGRFSGFILSSFVTPFFGRMTNLLPHTVSLMLFGTFVVFLLLRWVLRINDGLLMWVVAVLINNVAIMASLESSTFYWLCTAGYFIIPEVTLLMIGLLFFSESPSWIRWVGVVICSFVVCGASESYTPLVILVLGIYFLWSILVKKQYRFWEDERLMMLFVSLVIMSAGFLFMLFAPGNKVRMGGGDDASSFMTHFRLVPFLLTSVKATAILMLRLLSRSLWYLVLVPLFVWLGHYLYKKDIVFPEFKFKHFLISVVALGLFIFISVAACVYGMGWYAPPRANSYLTFVLMACVAFWGIGIGERFGEKYDSKWIAVGTCCSTLVLTVVTILFFIREQPEVKNYHAQIARRDAMIENEVAKGRTNPVTIEPLDIHLKMNSYYRLRNGIYRCFGKTFDKKNETWYPYMPSVLSEDPNDFKNMGLRRYYNADFDIIGWENGGPELVK